MLVRGTDLCEARQGQSSGQIADGSSDADLVLPWSEGL